MSGSGARGLLADPRGWVLAVYTLILFGLVPLRGMQWGDGLEFAAVSSHLGVAHPPGYPVLTAIGWVVLAVDVGDPYNRLVLLQRLLSTMLVGLVMGISGEVLRRCGHRGLAWPAAWAGAVFATGPHLFDAWFRFEAYHLLSVLAMATVWLLLADRGGPWRFLVAGVFGGLAVGTHLTGLALLPFFVHAALLGPRRYALGGLAIFLVLPVVLYGSLLLRVPTAESAEGIYWGAPTGLAGLLSHVGGGEFGRFRLLQAAPGVPFTAASYITFATARTVQLLEAAGAIIADRGLVGIASGLAVALATACGFRRIWRQDAGLAASWIAALALQLAFVYMYNIPDIADYFVLLLSLGFPLVVAGLLTRGESLRGRLAVDDSRLVRLVVIMAVAAVLAGIPAGVREARAWHREIPGLWGERLLEALEPGVAVITSGDADVYTLWHIRFVEGRRQDLVVVGGNFLREEWFRLTLPADDERRRVVRFGGGVPQSMEAYLDRLATDVIDPLAAAGPVYMTNANWEEVEALRERYRVLPAAELLRPEEVEALRVGGEIQMAPPVLWRLERIAPPER